MTSEVGVWLGPGLPLLLALLLGIGRLRPGVFRLLGVAALPALVSAFLPKSVVALPWVLTGIAFSNAGRATPLLLLTGLLWSAAGIYAGGYLKRDPCFARFCFFFLLTLSGNVGVVLAVDLVSFYLFYTLMTLAAYGLIVHTGSVEAIRAGRVYLIMGISGEVLLLVTILISAAQFGETELRQLAALLAQADNRDTLMGLVFVAFAIKVGAAPLHVWLPLAHPHAPPPASAVLSGIIIKTGLIGWLQFLPLGHIALMEWSGVCFLVGLVSTFFAVLVGLFQARPKTVLAYSSISQMGLLTLLLSLGLRMPTQWDLILNTLVFFIFHHGIAKALLFLGLGAVEKAKSWRYYGFFLLLPALTLVGAPLSSGALAKAAFEANLKGIPEDWAAVYYPLLTLSSVATGLLMARFLYLARPCASARAPISPLLWLPCGGLLLISLTLPWWWRYGFTPMDSAQLLEPEKLLTGFVPVLLAGGLAVASWWLWRWFGRRRLWLLPEGDLLEFWPRLGASVQRLLQPARSAPEIDMAPPQGSRQWQRLLAVSENYFNSTGWIGLAFLGLIMGFMVLLWLG